MVSIMRHHKRVEGFESGHKILECRAGQRVGTHAPARLGGGLKSPADAKVDYCIIPVPESAAGPRLILSASHQLKVFE